MTSGIQSSTSHGAEFRGGARTLRQPGHFQVSKVKAGHIAVKARGQASVPWGVQDHLVTSKLLYNLICCEHSSRIHFLRFLENPKNAAFYVF